MKNISIIMPYLNEEDEPIETVKSIYETAPQDSFTIYAIDDASERPSLDFSHFKDVRNIRNSQRKGVDASRQLGVQLAETPYVFIIDAHMRFKQDSWLEKIIDCLSREPNTAWCTVCVGLGYGEKNIYTSKSRYYGADMLFVDSKANPNKPAREVLEPKWAVKKNHLEYEIPCILGANYAFTKKWFTHIRGLQGLKGWGTSEPFLSLKTWLSGGKCKIRTDVEIGHKFRSNAPYSTKISYLVYNKIFLCKTILPEKMGDELINYLPHNNSFNNAMKMIKDDEEVIRADRSYYQSIFKKSIYNYCDQFKISLPSEISRN